MTTEELSGWGRYLPRLCSVTRPDGPDNIALQAGSIARGNGRAYGDSAIGASATIDMRNLNRMLSFNAENGHLTAEAGVLLGDIIAALLPRGWFPFVTPGTKFVTLGGAIAADVHGKNHHVDGSFGAFVEWIDILGVDGKVTRASRAENAFLFEWTIGGMGLTGVILRACIRLRSVETGWISQATIPAPNLDAAMSALGAEGEAATYSVAWIDCLAKGDNLGRSIVMTGEHTKRRELQSHQRNNALLLPERPKKTIPFNAPGMALNRLTVGAFNALYWAKGIRSAGRQLVDWDSYFYPLDAILGWNRIYGRNGFVQFQCVLPPDTARDGLAELLKETAKAGQGSFLAVLKKMGPQNSRFSFPMEGFTLALDFPARPETLRLITRLDDIALEHEGRFYLAKDARMSAQTLSASDERAEAFRKMRRDAELDRAFASSQSTRIGL